MSIDQLLLADAFARVDFMSFANLAFAELNPGRPFIPNWHHEAITYRLNLAMTGEHDRIIINMPPRAGKSTLVSVALPAFILGQDPTRRIIVVSYNQDLSLMFSRQTRQLMRTDWYRRLFPSTQLVRSVEAQFYTSMGGFRLATSTGGTFTGKGGDMIIIDDPLKAADADSENARATSLDWTANTLFSRLDDKRHGSIILVQQRQHEDDLTGHMLRSPECWLQLSLPAIATEEENIILSREPLRFHHRRPGDVLEPIREPLAVLDRQKMLMGTSAFSAQYQQDPLPPDGDAIKLSWFKTYDTLPDDAETIFSVDTASKDGLRNDWSVIQVWRVADGRYYLDHVWRRKVLYPELKAALLDLYNEFRPDTILIEDKGAGIGLIQDLKAERYGYPVVAYDPGQVPKELRVRVQSAKIEAGLVLLPRQAFWLEEFQKEVRRFPHGTHDDQMDAMAQLLDYKSNRGPGELFIRSYRV